jgi:hypothetical protein
MPRLNYAQDYRPLPAYARYLPFLDEGALTQIDMSNHQNLEPSQDEYKSALMQTEGQEI